jgi:hypothetical protein
MACIAWAACAPDARGGRGRFGRRCRRNADADRDSAQDAAGDGRRHSRGHAATGEPGADPALPQRPARPLRDEMARESQLIYAPLANRLGIWHVKWELEDLSFRYLEPETYKRIATMLDEKRSEREGFIAAAVERLKAELGRRRRRRRDPWPAQAHLQHLEQDARQGHRFRPCVRRAGGAYHRSGGQGLLHRAGHRAPPVATDPRRVRRLHLASQGQLLPVPAHRRRGRGRTFAGSADTHPEMHEHAELGVAAHWRYKESAQVGEGGRRLRGQDLLATAVALMARRDRGFGGMGATVQAGRAGRHGLCPDAAGQGDRPAARRDRAGFRLSPAHRPRASLPRRACRWPHGAAQHGLAERAAGGGRHREERRTVARLAEPDAGLPGDAARAFEGQAVVCGPGRGRDAGAGTRPGHARTAARRADPGQPRRTGRQARTEKRRSAVPGRGARRGRPARHRCRLARRRRAAAARAGNPDAQEPRRRQPDPDRGRGQTDDPGRYLLQADATRRDHRVRHSRQWNFHPSHRMQQLPQHGGAQSRAGDRCHLGRAGREYLFGGADGRCRGSPGPAARHIRYPVPRKNQCHRGQYAVAGRHRAYELRHRAFRRGSPGESAILAA